MNRDDKAHYDTWEDGRKATAVHFLRSRLEYLDRCIADRGDPDDFYPRGPYDTEDLADDAEAAILRWIWEKIDPAGYARWLDTVSTGGPR